MDNPTRSFIAIPCNQIIRKKVSTLQKQCRDVPCEIKWVKPQNIHLTLQFLGDLAETELTEVQNVLAFVLRKTGPFDVALTHLGGFPNLNRPHVLWIGLNDKNQKLKRLSKTIRDAIFQLNIKPDKKHFIPHLTVGRVKSVQAKRPFKGLGRDETDFSDLVMPVNQVNLYKSTLTPDGPIHDVIRKYQL